MLYLDQCFFHHNTSSNRKTHPLCWIPQQNIKREKDDKENQQEKRKQRERQTKKELNKERGRKDTK
jgi:hypothetical protein